MKTLNIKFIVSAFLSHSYSEKYVPIVLTFVQIRTIYSVQDNNEKKAKKKDSEKIKFLIGS